MRTRILFIILILASGLLLSQKNCNEDRVCYRNGQTRSCYSGPKGTKGEGICKAGKQTCVDYKWSKCQGEVLPEKEICDDNIDQDCNGSDRPCTCGDDQCEGNETVSNCPEDCDGACGDTVCNIFAGEDLATCPQDCPGTCGDSVCNSYYETPANCGQDCPGTCGDEVCNSFSGEDVNSCPQDCSGTCGDSVCNSFAGEDVNNCPRDCPGACNDGICNSFFEDPSTCGQDCPGTCGDEVCNSFAGENLANCPQDCPGTCGDSVCNSYYETPANCGQDCPGTCGDGVCNHWFENPGNCAVECFDDAYRWGFSLDDYSGEFKHCLSRIYGPGFAGYPNLFLLRYCDTLYGYVDVEIISGDAGSQLELCATSYSCCPGKVRSEYCKPVDDYSRLFLFCEVGEDLYINVSLNSGNNVVYDMCWQFGGCGDLWCEGTEPENCPQDCCYCGDFYCVSAPPCGEDSRTCPHDCH